MASKPPLGLWRLNEWVTFLTLLIKAPISEVRGRWLWKLYGGAHLETPLHPFLNLKRKMGDVLTSRVTIHSMLEIWTRVQVCSPLRRRNQQRTKSQFLLIFIKIMAPVNIKVKANVGFFNYIEICLTEQRLQFHTSFFFSGWSLRQQHKGNSECLTVFSNVW